MSDDYDVLFHALAEAGVTEVTVRRQCRLLSWLVAPSIESLTTPDERQPHPNPAYVGAIHGVSIFEAA